MSKATAPEFADLRLLVAVDRLGSLGQAAREAGISQPAASKRIASLERSFDMRLVERSPRGSHLTSEGLVVANYGRKVQTTLDQLMDSLALLRGSSAADLRVAASLTIAEHLMPLWLFELGQSSPALHVALGVANSRKVQDLVHKGEVDIGFVESPELDPRLNSKRIADDQLAVVVAPSHSWARRRRPILLEDVLRGPLIVRERGSGTRETLDRLLGEHAEPLLELGSNAAVKGAVMAGGGAAVLSVLAISGELEGGKLIEVPVQGIDLHRQLCAVWSKRSSLSRPSLMLLQLALTCDSHWERSIPP